MCIFNLCELRTLSLKCCGIRELPDTFNKLRKLSILDLGDNSIITIPKSLSKLMLLNSLNLRAVALYGPEITVTFNQIIKYGQRLYFPSFENKSQQQIEELIAEKCGIQSTSNVISEQPNDIQKLNSFIANECRRFESSASLKNDKAGDGFPYELLSLKQLEVLNLANQHIMQIPKDIIRLKNLKRLFLSGCIHLQEISEHLATIKNLEC